MMASDKPEFCRLERLIEIYENERLWVGRGFSKKGLLPTERGPFSTHDATISFKSMREASLALLRGDVVTSNNRRNSASDSVGGKVIRRGWSFHEPDNEHQSCSDDYECSSTSDNLIDEYCGFLPCKGAEDGPTDQDGWQYFADFKEQSLLRPSRTRGLLDFVRRRKLRRIAIFRPDHFLPRQVYSKCDFCDSKAVELLSDAMLDALSLASLFAHGPSHPEKVTDAQIIPLKTKLIDTLRIGKNYPGSSNEVNIDDIKQRLCSFAEDSVGKSGTVKLQHLFNPDMDKNIQEVQPIRRKVVEKYLPDEERIALARLLIKDIDREAHDLHCQNETCASSTTSSCPFQLISCPNYKCGMQISKLYAKEHDDECEYKMLPCPSGCGMEVARKDMHLHVTTRCILRQAECPLSMFGCTAIVQAADVTRHLNQHADTHFMLLSTRMIEYQQLFKQFDSKINMLEEKNAKLERELARTNALLAANKESLSNDLKKVTKRHNALDSTCRSEFRKLENDRRSRKK